MIRTLIVFLFAIAATASTAGAQGTLSAQGFGYPAGSLSARALATGGAVGEFDPLSPINPAALAGWGRGGLYAQYSPEWRRVDAPDGRDRATIARFPLVGLAFGVSGRAIAGLTASSLLDRTWQTEQRGYLFASPTDSTQFVESFRSEGAINDVRLGLAYALHRRATVGIAGHVLTGQNRLRIDETFADSEHLSFVQRSTISYSGTAISGGVVWRPINTLGLAMSGRLGGAMRSHSGDTVLTRAKVPRRFGAGLEFSGIAGVVLAARADWEGWSSLQPLSQTQLTTFDAWDVGVGAEVKGPSLLGGDLPVRVGFRRRTLPFAADGNEVRETSVAAGVGFPITGGRSRVDLTLQRAHRAAGGGGGGDVKERAWTFSAGVTVRP